MSYLNFIVYDTSKSGKTVIVNVASKGSGIVLGRIKWYAKWRCYVFYPENQTLFNMACLKEIAAKCWLMTEQQKKGVKVTQESIEGTVLV